MVTKNSLTITNTKRGTKIRASGIFARAIFESLTGPELGVVRFPDGTKLPANPHHFNEPDGKCHDCGVPHGEYHRPGCDVERCPRCGGQMLICECGGKKG